MPPLWQKSSDPALRQEYNQSSEGSHQRLHASLALLPVDPSQTEYLTNGMLLASPTELPVIWRILTQYHPAPVERFWDVLDDTQADKDRRFRAACDLANSDAVGTERRWDAVAPFVANRLIASILKNPSHYAPLIEMLRPVRDQLLSPLCSNIRHKKKPESERFLATSILADYASDQPDVLADLLMDSEERLFALLFEKLKTHQDRALVLLDAELAKKPAPEATEDAKDKLDQRQGRAAVALVRLERPEKMRTLLRHSPDPSVRSYIVNWLKPLGAGPDAMVGLLTGTGTPEAVIPVGNQSKMDAVLFHPETSVRRALILALGQYEADDFAPDVQKPLVTQLLDTYCNDPDAGIHGAAEWTLPRWKHEDIINECIFNLKGQDRGNRSWYANSEGQTLTVIEGPVEFSLGSPSAETDHVKDETLHRRWINLRFAIATKEVTVEQYQRFLGENPKIDRREINKYSPESTSPMNLMSWYEAAAYCNWLSRQENRKECYEPNPKGVYDEGMKIVADSLDRPGYRLPTEAEWEYSCRAGAVTSRNYGGSVELLGKYAWFNQNSMGHAWTCGQLQPNDLGLFDMLGNMNEWCNDPYELYDHRSEDLPNILIDTQNNILEKKHRLLRGGSFIAHAAFVRSADRSRYVPSNRLTNLGFRPARTYP
jgi:formylglycine-generating enzyme required for sulfatase activity